MVAVTNELTPEFLCWAIERQCPLRELLPENQPEKVERQLRSARCTSEALAEGRVADDLAITADQTLGFRVSEALAIYGGEAIVRDCCGNCPANVNSQFQQPSYAGCYGLFPVPEPREPWLQRTQRSPRDNQLFKPSQFLWYGWWLQSPLNPGQIEYLAKQFAAISSEAEFAGNQALREFTAALRICHELHLPLSVQLFPRGEIDGLWWNLVPHCEVCRSEWSAGAKRCEMCGQTRFPASAKKRRVRGTRPYRALSEINSAAHS